MMKRLCLFFVMSLFTFFCNAQTIRFGVRGGMNISTESSQKYPRYVVSSSRFKTGVSVGGAISIPISERIEIETDILYSLQGFKDYYYVTGDIGQADSREDYIVNSHYLNIPAVVEYFVVNGFYLECGPQVGILLSKKDNLEESFYGNMYDHSKAKKVDMSLVAGLGYRFDNDIFINARYCHGLTDTSKIYEGGKNRNIQISLGYFF